MDSFKDAREIVIYSCSTGKAPNGFAAELAKLLGRPVWSPSDYLWILLNGSSMTASKITLGLMPGDGKWIRFP